MTPQLSQTALAKETSWRFTETRLTGSEPGVESLCPVSFFADETVSSFQFASVDSLAIAARSLLGQFSGRSRFCHSYGFASRFSYLRKPAVFQLHSLFLLHNHFVRILVSPDTDKNRMTKTIISRPFSEFHLANHHRFDPTATFHFGGGQPLVPTTPAFCREPALVGLGLLEIRIETAKKLLAKAGSDSTAELELVAFVESDK